MTDSPQGKAVLRDNTRFVFCNQDEKEALLPPDFKGEVHFRTAFEIERDRRAAKGLPMPIRDGTHGE